MTSTEVDLLNALAAVECLDRENPILDGGALVMPIHCGKVACEFVVEVRLPGYVEPFGDQEPHESGFLWAYLQNVCDTAVPLDGPSFVLTGGLVLPWHVGLTTMHNLNRGDLGEVLSWRVPIPGPVDTALHASEIAAILEKCKRIVESSA